MEKNIEQTKKTTKKSADTSTKQSKTTKKSVETAAKQPKTTKKSVETAAKQPRTAKKSAETIEKQPKTERKSVKTIEKEPKTSKNNEILIKAADPEKVREAIRLIDERKAKEPKTFWGTIKALHAVEGLKDWLTLEAMPLMPLVEKKDNSFVLYLLFVAPSGKKTIGKPWGMAALALPESKILSKTRFDKETLEKLPVPETKMLCNKKFVDLIQKAYDENGKIPLPPQEILDIYAVVKREENQKAEESKPAKKVVLSWSEVIQYMDNVAKMLKEDSQEELLNDLVRLKKRLEQPLFSVAVVGEFSRGKSTFINNLFGKEFLPVGDLPTTAMLTKIIYGKKQKFFRFHDGKKEEITAKTLEKLVADDNGNDPTGVIVAETPFKFLNKNGVQFIDTPGAGDIFGKRAAITTETIASCDATIVTVSATMPLSLTEKSFVEDNIFLKKIPRVAVVVTRLDQIPEKERLKLYEYIKLEVGKWQKDIPVWVSGINLKRFGEGIVFGKDEILAEIEKWTQNSDNDKIRMMQIYAQTSLIKEKFAQILKEREEMLKTDKEEYAKQLKREEQLVLNQSLVWEDIAIDIEQRELAFSAWLREVLEGKAPEIKEDILFQVKNCPDPQKWWNDNFPFIFKRKMQGLSKELSAVIGRKIAAETEFIAKLAKEKFGTNFTFNSRNLPMETSDGFSNNEPGKIQNSNLEKIKTASRYLSAAAFMISAPLTPLTGGIPVGMLLSATAGIISEKVIKGKIDRQREQIARHVDDLLSKTFDQIIESNRVQIARTHSAIVKEIKDAQKNWLENAKKNFKKIENSDVAKELADVEKKITDLSQLN